MWWGHRRWRLVLFVVGLWPVALSAETSGPDAAGLILIDSAEDDGPPHGWVEMGESEVVLPGAVSLPFAFTMGGAAYETATISVEGGLVFDGSPSGCPGDGDWTGFLSGATSSAVRFRTLGRYPSRGLVWDWGAAQLVLLERRNEGVIHLGSTADAAEIGAQAGSGSGVIWACGDSESIADRTAWISDEGSRSVSRLRSTEQLSQAWWGSGAAEFFGEALAVGDVNADDLSDTLVGQPEMDRAHLYFGRMRDGIAESDSAAMVISGDSGSRLGSSVLLTDLDGDGQDDLVVAAPRDGAGGVFIFLAASGMHGELTPDDADAIIRPPSGLSRAGGSIAAGDFDGDGHIDLAVGAPDSLDGAPFGGGLMVARGPFGVGLTAVSIDDVRLGEFSAGRMGTSVVAIDLDGDGTDELAVGSPGADGLDEDAGRVEVFDLSSGLSDDPLITIEGDTDGDKFGVSMAAGDIDGLSLPALVVGASGVRSLGARAGAVYVFRSLDEDSLSALEADAVIDGVEGGAATGSAVALGQLDEDDALELAIGSIGGAITLGGGGMVAVFRDPPEGEMELTEADHRLYGSGAGAELGTCLAVASDIQGDGYPDLLTAAPLDSPGERVGAGAVWVWPFIPAYIDQDDDGFVAQVSGGLDCDDLDDSVHPNAAAIPDNTRDDDCDGWVDGWFVPRQTSDGFLYDIDDVLSVDGGTLFDFEDAEADALAHSVYSSEGMELIATGSARVKTSIWGAPPVGTKGVRVTAGSGANDLIMDFSAPVDAVGLRILDAEVGMRMDALFEGELVVDGYFFEAFGPDTPGGVFQGFTFSTPIDTLRIAAESPNGWGVDDIEVIFAAGSDRDGDGLSAEDGDCNDFDASIVPGAEEIYGDGVDNDCDGVIDGGAAGVYHSEGAFAAAISMIGDRIDFEEPVLGTLVTEQYLLRGISFAEDLRVVDAIGVSPPRDLQAGSIETDTVHMLFLENQPALAFWLLDVDGSVTLEGHRDGIELYSETLSPGLDGFVGIEFPVPIDRFTLRNSLSGELWGIDDVTFSVLGLDDADGDGFTERDGDCDDADPDARPGGEEIWYDGVDGDCDGADDYDADGDGYASTSGGGFDCDDFVDTTHPGAEDEWYDGVDADCRGDDDFDADGDGHSAGLYGGTDCDDDSDAVHPDAEEVFYDDTDDDCDPTTDYDADGDGYASTGFPGAVGAYGVGDCDDGSGSTHPGAEETWYDGIDSDCEGDDDYDADGDGHIPIEYGGDDCDDGDGSAVPGAPEDACYDGIDADCDGHSDFDCDRDGHDAVEWGGDDCADDDPTVFPGDGTTPEGLDADCDGYVSASAGGDDCDDGDASVHPGAEEIWYDGRDSDCAGDDDYDRDGDGHYPGAWSGDGVTPDCNDLDPAIHPGAEDGCGGGDEDCDGELDEDCAPIVDTGTPIDPDTGISDPPIDTGEPAADPEDSGASTDSGGPEVHDTGDVGGSDSGVIDDGETGAGPSGGAGSGGGGPGKGGNCGCKSAHMASSWVWLAPFFFVAWHRRRSFRGWNDEPHVVESPRIGGIRM